MSKKILVADDSVVIQKAIGITFAQEDYQVTFVGNGEEALQRAKEISPDLILADTSMPKLSGSELCKRLRAEIAFKKTPIILLGNNKESFSPAELKAFGANDFVQKPFESTQLLTKSKALLESSSPSESGLEQDILADSSVNEVPPSIGRSAPQPKGPTIEQFSDFSGQQEYFQEKTSGEANLPPQMDSYSSIPPAPGFVPNSGIDLLSNELEMDEESNEIPNQSILPEPDFSTQVFEKPEPVTSKPSPSTASSPSPTPTTLQLSEKQIEDIVARVFQNVIERIAWEVVPDLAERIIKDEIEKITREE